MPSIDNDTLLISLQSVCEDVKRLESLLESETLADVEDIEELLLSYDEALKVLKSVYLEQASEGVNLPPIEAILHVENTNSKI